MKSILDVHPFDRTRELAQRLDEMSAELWDLAAAHANEPRLAQGTDSEALRRLRDREEALLHHDDDEVRGIAASAARCAQIAADVEAELGEAEIPFA